MDAMHASLKIAVVEDHADLRDLFVELLSNDRHDVKGFYCAEELDEHLAGSVVDLLVLDLNLPGEGGYSIARRLRDSHPEISIIMITARTDVEDRIKGYLSGADIYLAKPVSPEELSAAVASIARRVDAARNRLPHLALDMAALKLTGSAGTVDVSIQEAQLLKGLAEAAGHRLDYWRLQELLQLDQDERGKATLEVRVSRLKKKLHEAGAAPPAIKSLWKEGYQVCVPVRVTT